MPTTFTDPMHRAHTWAIIPGTEQIAQVEILARHSDHIEARMIYSHDKKRMQIPNTMLNDDIEVLRSELVRMRALRIKI